MAVANAQAACVPCWWGLLLALMCMGWPLRLMASPLLWPQPARQDASTGLPAAQVRDIVEGPQGDLWLATELGLLTFDGRRFRFAAAAAGLPDSTPAQLHVDPNGRLWGLTTAQQLLWWSDQGRAVHRWPLPQASSSRPPQIRHLSSDVLGLWVGTAGDGLQVWRDSTGWRPASGLPSPQVTALARDRDGGMWIGTGRGLAYGRSAQVRSLSGWRSTPVQWLWPDPAGGMWIGTAQGAVHLDHPDAMPVPMRGVAQPWLLRGEAGEAWGQDADGLLLWRGARSQRVVLPQPGARPGRQPVIRQMLEDRSGGVWMRSEDHRLWRLPPRWQQFAALAPATDGPRDPFLRALAASRGGGAWVAGNQGHLQRLDPGAATPQPPPAFAPEIAEARALALAEDARGRVWIATAARLLRYDPGARRWTRWLLEAGTDPGAGPVALAVCPDGAVWVASAAQIQWRDADGTLRLHGTPAALGWTPPPSAMPLLCAADGTLWAGDRTGLRRWLPAREHFARVPGDVAADISALAEDAGGNLWASSTGVLQRYRWDGQRLQQMQRFDTAQGYPQLRAQALAVDAAGVAWAGSARGLVRASPHDGRVRLFDLGEGMPVQQVMSQRLRTLSDGTLVAAVREGGLLLIDPAARDPDRLRGLHVEEVSVHRQTLLALPATGTVPLQATDRNVRVAVRLAGVADAARVRYRFRLRAEENDWVETGALGQRMFARLPPGTHVLDVQAYHGGEERASSASIVLQVQPAAWQGGAGRFGIAVALCAGTALTGRWYRQRARRRWHDQTARAQRQAAARASQARTALLTQLGQQVRVPMSAVLGWSDVLRQAPLTGVQHGQVQCLHRAGGHLMQLMDDALDVAQVEAGLLQLHCTPFDLYALLHDLHVLLQPVAQARGLSLRWQVEVAQGAHVHGDPARLRQILLNLLGNALKFTTHGSVVLEATCGNGGSGLCLRVRDTGPGMSAAQQQRIFERFEQAEGARTAARHGGTGLGLAISRQLAQAMGGDIGVHSAEGQGSCFTLQLPLPHAVVASVGQPAAALEQPALHVLLVAPSVGAVVAALLRQLGHTVQVDEGLHLPAPAGAAAWDVIVADPSVGSGCGAIGARLSARWPGVPRVALSACTGAHAERHAQAAGYAVFLRLPVTAGQLAAALQRCVGAR
ncbi:ATP-binding protein [Stenotrophomonas sp. LGBM10]|uniref:hybrid sensor histidine kinase/response regulator n=1 Tax=Stenotrophomonas sp. LGBM10 TaxID=3390038 RepID=UPI00398A76B9